MTKTKKKVIKKKKPQPKPSTLLKRALALFGDKGERWVKNSYKIKPNNYHGSPFKKDKRIDPNVGEVFFPKGAYCSIGGIQEINTNREDEAKQYLALAIYPKFIRENITADNDESYIAEYADDSEEVIIEFNDNEETRFSDIKKKFNKAISLALKEGN